MEVSIFLAKLLGLYFLILGLICVFRNKEIKAMGKEFASSRITLAVSAEISLIFGLVIAIDHSIWEYSWRGLITLLGYLLIFRGVLRFGFPASVKRWVAKMTSKWFWGIVVIMVIIGAYLTYCGFTYPR